MRRAVSLPQLSYLFKNIQLVKKYLKGIQHSAKMMDIFRTGKDKDLVEACTLT